MVLSEYICVPFLSNDVVIVEIGFMCAANVVLNSCFKINYNLKSYLTQVLFDGKQFVIIHHSQTFIFVVQEVQFRIAYFYRYNLITGIFQLSAYFNLSLDS